MPETLTNFPVSVSQVDFFTSFDILSVVLHSISGHCMVMSTSSCLLNSEKFGQRFSDSIYVPYLHNLICNLTTKFLTKLTLYYLQFHQKWRVWMFEKFAKAGDLHRSRFKLGFSRTSSKIRCATQITWTRNWTSWSRWTRSVDPKFKLWWCSRP